MTISEKVAYIQGLFDGMGLDKKESGEAKILSEMLDVLKEVGEQLETMDATLDEYGEEIDALSDDLSDVEDVVFDEDEEDDDEDFFTVECPTCGKELVVDEDALVEGVIQCPGCGDTFALDLSDEEDEEEEDEKE